MKQININICIQHYQLDELNAELNMDKPENELVDGERDGDETASESKESRPENDRQEREQDDDRE